MEWSQINTSDFLFLTYVQFYILHPKLYTFGFYSESKCISDSEERSERPGIPSLTDVCSCQKEELVPCGAPGAWLSPGGSRQILCHTLSVSTLGRDVVDTGPTLKIQQPAITSRTRGSNFYLRACQGGLSQPAFGKEERNFPPPSVTSKIFHGDGTRKIKFSWQ